MGTFEVPVRVFSVDGSRQEQTNMLVDTGATFFTAACKRLEPCVEERLHVETEYATGEVETYWVWR
jgi:hypothetical protein